MTKLELNWYGKENNIKIEPRLLIEDPQLSNCSNDPNTDNILIHGDNLLALRALENKYSDKIKCIYIDPPYNTGAAFEHYDDNMEHSIWLSLMKQRLLILKKLLSNDGAICVQIDAVEMPYLKVLMDEIFGRNNFINIICVKAKVAGVSGSNLGKSLQDNVEYILMFAKNIKEFSLQSIPKKKQELMNVIEDYKNQGKSWKYTSVMVNIDEGEYIKSFKDGSGNEIKLYRHKDFETKSVNSIAKTMYDGNIKEAYYNEIEKVFRTTNAQTSIRTSFIKETEEYGNKGMYSIVYAPIKGKNKGVLTRFYYKDKNLLAWLKDVVEVEEESIYKIDNGGNLWDDIQYNNLTKEGDNIQFPNGKKPEELIMRIVQMLTKEGDYVLDSFLGSGTTCAVANKLGRKYIGIEMENHAYTHCKVRLDNVISGVDKGGISEKINWQGGGAYKFYELAPTLIEKDEFDEYVINPEYDANMLAAAVALNEGFKYEPDEDVFWKQAKGNEDSYLYTTTRHITEDYLSSIESMMDEKEYLVIACKSFDANLNSAYKNISLKKIPQLLLEKCEFGKDNYNLNIVHPPIIEEYDEEEIDE